MTSATARTIGAAASFSIDHSAPGVEVRSLGPNEAQFMLAVMNTHNRNMKPTKVNQYARAMARGEWKFNGEAIKISKAGVLLDGQNRLQAIIESGTTQDFLVITGLDETTQETMDQGASRNTADVLKLRGYTNTNVLAAVGRQALGYREYEAFDRRERDLPGTEVVAFVSNRLDSLYESITRGDGLYKYVNHPSRTWSSTLHYLFKHTDVPNADKEADTFFEQLKTGQSDNSTVVLLRKLLTRPEPRHHRSNDIVHSAQVIKAWNAWIDGREVKNLWFRAGGANPEKFPKIAYLDPDSL